MPIDPEIQRMDEDFRAICTEALYESDVPQKALADRNKVTQPHISRWFSYSGDSPLPAFRIPLLPKSIALPILKYLASKFEAVLFERNPSKMELDGKVTDEVLDLAQRVGKLAGEARDGKIDRKRCRREFEKIIEAAGKGIDELNAMESNVTPFKS